MGITLYSIPGSPPCRAVLMVLEYIGLEVDEIKQINPLQGDQMKPEFLQKNHLHTIPLIEDGDFILPDSHAIMTYLVSKYGSKYQATLYPSDLKKRATVDQRLFFDATTIFPIAKAIVSSIFGGETGVNDALKAKAEEAYEFSEKFLEKSTFFAGEHITVADLALVATISTLNIFVPIDSKFKKLNAWFANLRNHEWYQKGNLVGLTMMENFVQSKLTGK